MSPSLAAKRTAATGCNLRMDDAFNEKITQNELSDLLKIREPKQRFTTTLDLLVEKLRLLAQEHDHPLDYIVVVVPPSVYEKCRVADYHEKGVGMVHRDLRRAFKARAMEYHKATQLIQESTLSGEAVTAISITNPSALGTFSTDSISKWTDYRGDPRAYPLRVVLSE